LFEVERKKKQKIETVETEVDKIMIEEVSDSSYKQQK